MQRSELKRIVAESALARDRAETLLRALHDARAESEKRLADSRQPDILKKVTGRSAMDNAIASTQRMIDSINRAMADVRAKLSEDDLAELDAPDPT